jgi:deferrochelatase/peroxidase EfeB
MNRVQAPHARRRPARVPLLERGPGQSYLPEDPDVGRHQPGIATAMLDHVAFGALDVTVAGASELSCLLRELMAQAAALISDTPRRTVTVGLGPGLFGDRFGLAAQRPVALRELPAFPGDELDPALCGGDICVQACADEREQAGAALQRMISRVGGAARLRWRQDGFVHRERDGRPRNLLGFHDGIDIPRRGRDLDRHVWVTRGDRTWMVGGTFLVVRRIELRLGEWQALSVAEQERVIGRRRDTGAPLGAKQLYDRPPLETDAIAPDAHLRLAAPQTNGGAVMLRRAYSYESGLLLLAYQADPRRQFVPVQRRLAEHDALSRFSRPIGSAVFALPRDAVLFPTARTSARSRRA